MSRTIFVKWLFIVSSALFLWLFFVFLKPFLIASILVLATYMPAKRLEYKMGTSKYEWVKKNKELLSALSFTTLFTVLIVAPVAYVIAYVLSDAFNYDMSVIMKFKENIISYVGSIDFVSDNLKQKAFFYIDSLFSIEFWAKEAKNIFSGMGSVLQGVLSGATELGLIVIFFFLIHWFKIDIKNFILSLIDIGEDDKKSISKELVSTTTVVLVSMLGLMIVQGVAFFALMLFFDYNALLLGFFAGLSSIVPIVGSAIVWIPVALSELINGNIISALIIVLYSWLVMAFLIDNFIRLILINKVTELLNIEYKMNEFLFFFATISGIAVFGFWGVIVGPFVVALFLSSAKIYSKNRGISS